MMPRNRGGLVAVAVCMLAVGGAIADISEPAITIIAQNTSGTATWSQPLSAFGTDPDTLERVYTVEAPINLTDDVGGQFVARLRSFELYLQDVPGLIPHITMQASVMAGTSDTTFTIVPGTVSFGPLYPPEVGALMSYVLIATDNEAPGGGDNHVLMQGLPNGSDSDIIRDYLNDTVRFGYSDQVLEAFGPGGGMSTSGNYPGVGFELQPMPIYNMRTTVGFTLTPNDYGQVQTQFAVIPEPTALALIGLGGLSVLVRRR